MDYNTRLFGSSGFRRWYHIARFEWMRQHIEMLNQQIRIIELGCFDGRTLDYISDSKLAYYCGYDANWEGGLSLANERSEKGRIIFREASSSDELFKTDNFNVFISLETLEHLDEDALEKYLKSIKDLLAPASTILVTVPNEVGPLFVMKTILKKLLYNNSEGYTFREAVFQTLGKNKYVKRNQHKGFRWRDMQIKLSMIFECEVKAIGVHFPFLPPWFSPSIGLVGKLQ